MNRIFSLCLILCVLLFATTIVFAKTWVEDFNTASFDSWTKHDPENRSTWRPKDGRLDVWAQPSPPPGLPDRYVLEFTGFRFDVEKLSVKVRILEAHNTGVGILIGQYDGQGSITLRTIAFLHRSVFSVIWKPKGFELIRKAKNENPTPAPLEAMEISFNKGDFEVLTKGKFIVKYHVPQLPTINCIGLVSIVGRGRGVVAHSVLDNFVISGPNVPAHGTLNVRPKGKATVLWGELKQQ
ncbi:MAG: hypothetical protein OXI67_22125 [Candidatus Poribacteria bacterium]|nr:hypothetical protein [Candidatus Poribacteria bacterium]